MVDSENVCLHGITVQNLSLIHISAWSGWEDTMSTKFAGGVAEDDGDGGVLSRESLQGLLEMCIRDRRSA